MNKYLIEILKNHSSLILPGIGALMVTNRKTGEIKFNPHLTFNDGALANFIANQENIDKVEAQNKVAKFTSEIKSVIDKGETYDIFQFGTIFKNKNGETAFEMASKAKEENTGDIVDKAKVVAEKAVKPVKASGDKAKDIVEKSTDTVKETASTVSGKVADKVDSAAKAVKDKGEAALKKTSSIVKNTAKKAEKKTEEAGKAASKTASTIIDKSVTAATSASEKTISVVKDGIKSGTDATKKMADKTGDAVDKVLEKAKNVKNTYIPPVDKEKLPDVPKIVSSTASSTSKTVENIANKTKETITATQEVIEKKKRRWWPIIILLLLIGIAVAAYYFRDKIKSYLGWNDKAKIENVNNYPDADGDGIPDFADIDLTGGADADGDGIDDLADLDYTKGTDADGDGIDDTFAAAAMESDLDEDMDPLAMADEDGDGIPDYADINFTGGTDANDNGIDDRFDSSITLGIDADKDCIDDSLANIALLDHLKSQMEDIDADGIPDYADVDLTGGTDINKNGIDDASESIDMDRNGDGLNDSILIAMATRPAGMDIDEGIDMNIEDEEMGTEEEANEEGENGEDEVEETIVEETPVVIESIPTPPVIQKSTSDYSATGNYHAIGAAFAEKSNAENYTSEMAGKGFSAKIIGRFDGLYLVSIKQYSSMGDARTDLSNMRNTSSSAWIFKH